MISINNSIAIKTFIPAIAIITGAILYNGGRQYDLFNKTPQNIGLVLFIFAWIAMAYVVGENKNLLAIFSSLSILISILVITKNREDTKLPSYTYAFIAIYIIAWLLLAYSVTKGKAPIALIFGLCAAACVSLAVLVFLPWQRTHKVVDGPGMVLFGLGMVLLVVARSIQS